MPSAPPPPLMSIIAEMDAMTSERVAAVIDAVVAGDPSLIAEVLNAATDRGTWRQLAPRLELLSADTRATVAALAGEFSRKRLEHIVRDATAAPETLPALITIIGEMDKAGQRRVADVIAAVPQPLATGLLSRLDPAEQDEVTRQLPPVVQGTVSQRLADAGMTSEGAR